MIRLCAQIFLVAAIRGVGVISVAPKDDQTLLASVRVVVRKVSVRLTLGAE